jgi:hypothetical protein
MLQKTLWLTILQQEAFERTAKSRRRPVGFLPGGCAPGRCANSQPRTAAIRGIGDVRRDEFVQALSNLMNVQLLLRSR